MDRWLSQAGIGAEKLWIATIAMVLTPLRKRSRASASMKVPSRFFVENVPAFVCLLCGDKSYSGETLESLEQIRDGKFAATNAQVVLVFDFQRLDESGHRAFAIGSHRDPEIQGQNWHRFFYGTLGRKPEVVQLQGQYTFMNPANWDRNVIRFNEAWSDHVDIFPVEDIHPRIYNASSKYVAR